MRKYRVIVSGQSDVYIDAPMSKNVSHSGYILVIGDIASDDFVSMNFLGKIESITEM